MRWNAILISCAVASLRILGTMAAFLLIPGCGIAEYNAATAHYKTAIDLEHQGNWDAAIAEFHEGCTSQLEANSAVPCRAQEQDLIARAKFEREKQAATRGPTPLDESAMHYKRYNELFQAGDYDAAIQEFRRGCDLALSVAPNAGCRATEIGLEGVGHMMRGSQLLQGANPNWDAAIVEFHRGCDLALSQHPLSDCRTAERTMIEGRAKSGAATTASSAASVPAASAPGCAKDTDCKDVRICEKGQCVAPHK